ncbi:MAG: ABC transporter permease [Actinomycetota bacterium]|nr:ABC transporter permease [Actinomycetota bacterium]
MSVSFDRLSGWLRAGALAAALTVATTLIVVAFAWPTSRANPRELPVVVAPAAAAQQVRGQLAASGAGQLLDISGVADEPAARAALADRTAFGAIVVGPNGPRVLKAGAASPAVGQLLDQLAATLATGKPPATAQDVVPPPAGDPHGSAFATAVLPLTLSALIVGSAFGLGIRQRRPRLVGVLGTAAAIGVCFTLVLDSWLGLLGGAFLAEAAVIALAIGAVALPVSGLAALIGAPASGVGAGVFVLLGVPLAGLAVPWQAMPDFWGQFGRYLPAGAGGELLRRVSFFPAASVTFPLLVLLGWLVVGLAATLVPRHRLAATGGRHEAVVDEQLAVT